MLPRSPFVCCFPRLAENQGFSTALNALLGLGHRHIGMVFGFSWGSHTVRERFRAYRDVLTKEGIALEPGYCVNGGFSLDGAARATDRLLSIVHPPTAIIYWSDLMAIAGMDAARQKGIVIPRDLSVIGFDDLPLSSRVFPKLSSIRQPSYDAGVAMARRVIDRIEGKYEGPFGRVVSPTQFILRQSTARCPA